MTTALPPTAAAYVRSINESDAGAFMALFDDSAVVNDAGREHRGRAAIKAWSEKDIFAARVTLDVIGVAGDGLKTAITTRVDGNFDRTGLLDPVILDHAIRVAGGRIVEVTCKLVGERTGV